METHDRSMSIKRTKDGKWVSFIIHTALCLPTATITTAISINLCHSTHTHSTRTHTHALIFVKLLSVFLQGKWYIEAHHISVWTMRASWVREESYPLTQPLWWYDQNVADKSKEASGLWEPLQLVLVVTAERGPSMNPNMHGPNSAPSPEGACEGDNDPYNIIYIQTETNSRTRWGSLKNSKLKPAN